MSLPSLRTAASSVGRGPCGGRRVAGRRSGDGPVVHHLVPPQAGVASAGGRRDRRGCRARPPGPASRTRISSTWLEPGQAVGDEDGSSGPRSGPSRSAVRASAAAGSRCSAGSSRTRIGKSASRARATATRWRWPPERRAPAGPTSVARPAGSPASQSPRPTRSRTSTQLVVGRRAPARPAGSRPGSCRRGGRPGSTSPTTVRTSSADSRSSGTPSRVASPAVDGQEAHQDVGQRRLAGPARPDQGHPASRGEVEVDPAQDRSARCRGSRPTPSAGASVWAGTAPGSGSGTSGSSTGAGASVDGEHPAGRRARALQGLGGRRQRDHQLEGGQRDEREHGQQRAVEVAARGWRAPRRARAAPAGQPGQQRWSGRARCRRCPRRWRAVARQLGVRLARSGPAAAPVPPMTISSGAPSMRSTTAAPSSPRADACLDSSRRARRPGEPGHHAWPRRRGPPAARRRRRAAATT